MKNDYIIKDFDDLYKGTDLLSTDKFEYNFRVGNIFIDKSLISNLSDDLKRSKLHLVQAHEGRGKTYLGKLILYHLSIEDNFKPLYLDLKNINENSLISVLSSIKDKIGKNSAYVICFDNIHTRPDSIDLIVNYCKNISYEKNVISILLSRPIQFSRYINPYSEIKKRSITSLSPSKKYLQGTIRTRSRATDKIADQVIKTLESFGQENPNNYGYNLRLCSLFTDYFINNKERSDSVNLDNIWTSFFEWYLKTELKALTDENFENNLKLISYLSSIYMFDVPVRVKLDKPIKEMVSKGLIGYENNHVQFPHTIDAAIISKGASKFFQKETNSFIASNLVDYLFHLSQTITDHIEYDVTIKELSKKIWEQKKEYCYFYEILASNQKKSKNIIQNGLILFGNTLAYLLYYKDKAKAKLFYESNKLNIKSKIQFFRTRSLVFHFDDLNKIGISSKDFIKFYFSTKKSAVKFIERATSLESSGNIRRLLNHINQVYHIDLDLDHGVANLLNRVVDERFIPISLPSQISNFSNEQIIYIIETIKGNFYTDNRISILEFEIILNRVKRIKFKETTNYYKDLFIERLLDLKPVVINNFRLSNGLNRLKRNNLETDKKFAFSYLKNIIIENEIDDESIHVVLHAFDLNIKRLNDLIFQKMEALSLDEKNVFERHWKVFNDKYDCLTGLLSKIELDVNGKLSLTIDKK